MNEQIPYLKIIEAPASLKEIAFHAIKEAIMNNQLRQGNFYGEQDLSRELGISRTPVHEALIELSSRGFLKLVPRKGFQINELNKEEIKKLYTFRIALETTVIREITPKITDELILELEAISRKQKQMVEVGNWMGILKVDRELHNFLASLTQNTYIISALENVRDLIDWTGVKILAERKERPKEVIREHNAIIDRLKARDVDGAVSMMEKHLKISRERVTRFITLSRVAGMQSADGKSEPVNGASL